MCKILHNVFAKNKNSFRVYLLLAHIVVVYNSLAESECTESIEQIVFVEALYVNP